MSRAFGGEGDADSKPVSRATFPSCLQGLLDVPRVEDPAGYRAGNPPGYLRWAVGAPPLDGEPDKVEAGLDD